MAQIEHEVYCLHEDLGGVTLTQAIEQPALVDEAHLVGAVPQAEAVRVFERYMTPLFEGYPLVPYRERLAHLFLVFVQNGMPWTNRQMYWVVSSMLVSSLELFEALVDPPESARPPEFCPERIVDYLRYEVIREDANTHSPDEGYQWVKDSPLLSIFLCVSWRDYSYEPGTHPRWKVSLDSLLDELYRQARGGDSLCQRLYGALQKRGQ